MNWPPLTAETTATLGNVLRDVVHSKPKDLIETVAQILQEQSKWDPDEFEQFFEECKRKPRTYVLEDRCPAGQDPLAWVPMRFNDDTILLSLSQRALELVADIRSEEPLEDPKGFLMRCMVAFPEIQYLKDTPGELEAFQALRAICLGCGGEETPVLDDADPQLTFRCEALVNAMRQRGGGLLEPAAQDAELLEALIIACILRVVGAHEGFRRLFGGPATTPEAAILFAAENHHEVLPSLYRLPEARRQLVIATLQAYFSLDLLISAEAAPYHIQRVKEVVVPVEFGVSFFLCVGAIDHMVKMRTALVTDELVDLLRLSAQCLASVEKHSGAKAYELLLKKRAEKHGWRLVRDDFMCRAVVRLACMSRREDTEWWNEVQSMVNQKLDGPLQEALKAELGRKDGINESPVLCMFGASGLISSACQNEAIGPLSGIKMLINIMEDMVRLNEKGSITMRLISLHMETLGPKARDWRGGGGPFEATPHAITELAPGEASVQLMG